MSKYRRMRKHARTPKKVGHSWPFFWQSRYWLLAAILMLLLPARLGLLPDFSCGGRISQQSCDKVEVGMSEKEVKSILGSHPKVYATGDGWTMKIWGDREGIVLVTFHETDNTVAKHAQFYSLQSRAPWRYWPRV